MLVGLLSWLAAPQARAWISGWIDFDRAIPGEAREVNHPQWIDIESFGIDAKLTAGQPGAFYFTKSLDRASPALFLACAKNTRFPRANLDLASIAETGEAVNFLRLKLEDVMISSVQISRNSDASRPMESIGLAFGRITYTYYLAPKSTLSTNFDYRFKTGSDGIGANPDVDADGMPDSWETLYNLSSGTNDGGADADGDGLSNLNEYLLGTHPRSGTSFFKAQLSPVPASPGSYQLSWNSVPGTTYVIEWSPDLITPFTALRSVTAAGTTSSQNFGNVGSVGFYRVRPQL